MKRKAARKFLRITAEYGAMLIIGIILYKLARPYAAAWRNSAAVGGEIVLLGLPIWYGMVKSVVTDIVYFCKAWLED